MLEKECSVKIQLEYKPVSSDFSVFKKQIIDSKSLMCLVETQGFVLTHKLKKCLEIQSLTPAELLDIPSDLKSYIQPILVKKNFPEILLSPKWLTNDRDQSIIYSNLKYDLYNSGEYLCVLYDSYYDYYYDVNLEIFPQIKSFNYFEQFDNANYNLNLAKEILLQRTDIINLEITNIPYYNADKKRFKSLEFMWKPSKEDYLKIINLRNSSKKQYSEAVFELDLLGLRAAGAAKYDSYYGGYEQG